MNLTSLKLLVAGTTLAILPGAPLAQAQTPPPSTPVSVTSQPVSAPIAIAPPPTSFKNSLGLKFVSVPETGTLFCIYKTRVRDYASFASSMHREWKRPDFHQTENDPAVNVSWEDAIAFCGWLTQIEHQSKTLPADWKYRLPTDAEWSLAVGLPANDSNASNIYPWGTDWPPPRGAGNYHPSLGVDSFAHTSPVGSFAANAFGLFDLGGNAWEWCMDSYNGSPDFRILRGASWHLRNPGDLLSSERVGNQPDLHLDTYGFRCVIERPTPAPPVEVPTPVPATSTNSAPVQ